MNFNLEKNIGIGLFFDSIILILTIGIGLLIASLDDFNLIFGIVNVLLLLVGLVLVALLYMGRFVRRGMFIFFSVVVLDILILYFFGSPIVWTILLAVVAIVGMYSLFVLPKIQ